MTESHDAAGGLAAMHCRPLAKGTPPLGPERVAALLAQVPGWEQSGAQISKTYSFKDYHETMAFVNAAAWVSHREDHHPDLEVGYNKCRVHYSTHSVGGLSDNDFICAAKLEALFAI